ncbi:MAG: TetR-like C-terminal domain-containing protein [Anaerolineales bacterium]
MLAKYLTGGLISLFEWWIENEMPYSPDEMDKLFRDLAMPGILEMIDQDI